MRIKYLLVYIVCCIGIFNSCTRDAHNISIDGFCELESDLIQKFGQKSYFTDLTIIQNDEQQMEVNLLVTNNPYTYKMEGWNYKNGDWEKITEVDLELLKGDIKNYLYTIEKEVNIIKIGYLIELCIQRTKEKGYQNVTFSKVDIVSPDDGNKLKMGYTIFLTADNDKINYLYSLEGDLIHNNVL